VSRVNTYISNGKLAVLYCHNKIKLFVLATLDIASRSHILISKLKEFKMPQKVKMFTLSTCSHCKAAKKFMNDNGITYDCTDVDLLQGAERENILQEVMHYNPQRSFPTIVIDDKIIIGFRENDIREALGIK
jgi:glutaredoxin